VEVQPVANLLVPDRRKLGGAEPLPVCEFIAAVGFGELVHLIRVERIHAPRPELRVGGKHEAAELRPALHEPLLYLSDGVAVDEPLEGVEAFALSDFGDDVVGREPVVGDAGEHEI
jgi:hypothetical protein